MPETLVKLAQVGTDQARCALFGKLCERVTKNIEDRTTQELAIFAEVALKLYADAALSDRIDLARSLSDCPDTPRPLAQRLATDDVSVAQSILRSCRGLTEEDLLMFIDTLGVAQREAIAGRSDLTTKVSDALVLNGEQQVHRVLAGNMEIRLSRQAMLVFVKKAVEDEVLREHLALRPDLTPGVCQKLLPLVTGEAKQRLHSLIQGALSQEQLDQIARLKEVRRDLGSALDNQDMTLLWADAKRAKVTADELVLLLLQDKRFNHVIELMSTCGRIAQKALKDAVYNGKTETVLRTAARCRLKTHTFSLFAKARCAHLRIPDAQESEWVTAYSDYLKSLKPAVPGRGGDFKAKRGNRAATSKKPVTGADLTVT